MFKNYLKITFRNIAKQKGYSFINITGLALGMALFILIARYIQFEFSFDKFHKNYKQIHRIEYNYDGKGRFIAFSHLPIGAALVRDFPEIERFTRFLNMENGKLLSAGDDRKFAEDLGLWVEQSFFDLFSYKLLKGDPNTALAEPNSIVLSEQLAKKYFPDEEPLGKVMLFENRFDCKVTGVIENCPTNSHIQYAFLISYPTFKAIAGNDYFDSWISIANYTYVLLAENTNLDELNTKLHDILKKYWRDDVEMPVYLKPLAQIHFHSNILGEIGQRGDMNKIVIFSAIGLFIILIACINFMNLATARSARRTKEIGMRKVVGANKLSLVKQFLSESILFALLALLLAAVLAEIFLPLFNNMIGRTLTLNFFNNWRLSMGLIGIALIVGLIAGSYPAFYLASFQPAMILKGPAFSQSGNAAARKFLVVFQFVISIILIIGTLIIYRQMHYMRTTDLGYNHDQILITQLIRMDRETINKYHTLKNELLTNPNIINASISQDVPSFNSSSTVIMGWEGSIEGDRAYVNMNRIDEKFLATYQIQLIDGRNFLSNEASDSITNCIINESALKRFGWDHAIGKRLGGNLQVIGLVKDFHYASLRFEINPLVLFPPAEPNPARRTRDLLSIKIASQRIDETLTFIKNKFQSLFPNDIFVYRFFDEDFDIIYRQEIRVAKTIGYFSILAIFIASLGLFGLASFMAEQRTKEIGVRKTLGASLPGIILLLSKEFTRWILLAAIIAWPVGYFVMNKWLQGFAYRVDAGILIFILAGILALVIALVTVSYQAIKAALANPIHSLRYE
ncbi:ABC transporter permease [candidate division KSB1 bacterium]|nr:ABC transporter permease [candidate division KSB1 bacterium]